MLDVPLYASRIEKRRFLLKSDYPLKRGCLKFAFETAFFFLIPSDINFRRTLERLANPFSLSLKAKVGNAALKTVVEL